MDIGLWFVKQEIIFFYEIFPISFPSPLEHALGNKYWNVTSRHIRKLRHTKWPNDLITNKPTDQPTDISILREVVLPNCCSFWVTTFPLSWFSDFRIICNLTKEWLTAPPLQLLSHLLFPRKIFRLKFKTFASSWQRCYTVLLFWWNIIYIYWNF